MALVTVTAEESGHSTGRTRARAVPLGVIEAVGLAGVVAYNWWVVVPFRHGWMRSPNELFSDLAANGQPHAAVLQRLDVLAGVLLAVTFLVRGASGRAAREWPWLVAFGSAAAIGGRFSFSCASGLDSTCRYRELHLALPAHHYVHMVMGVAEFAAITMAIVLAFRRTRLGNTLEARAVRALVPVLAIAYPLLGVAFLTDRFGAFVEPVFFVAFTVFMLVELFEPPSKSSPRRTSGSACCDATAVICHAGPDGGSGATFGGHMETIEKVGEAVVGPVLQEAADELTGQSKRIWAVILVAFVLGSVATVVVRKYRKRRAAENAIGPDADPRRLPRVPHRWRNAERRRRVPAADASNGRRPRARCADLPRPTPRG